MISANAYLGGLAALVAAPRSREALQRFQLRRLQALLAHAHARVPYYRRLFDRTGLAPYDIRTLDDLGRIPISDKADFSNASDADVVARGVPHDRIVRYATSGSTGVPMHVRSTQFETRLLQAFRMRIMMRLGLRATDRRSLLLSGRPASAATAPQQRAGLFQSRVTNAAWPRERILADLRAWEPHVIRGYPSVLSSLAGVMTDDDRARIRPRFITTDSEQLTAHMRQQIEQGFGVPVRDLYDCYECNVIAWQCPTGGQYHVLDAAVIVEILKDGRPAAPGEAGELVMTPLHSWAAPLIRYRIGDLVERGADRCPCGSPASCIGQVRGRLQDRLVLADGRYIHPYMFDAWIKQLIPNLRSHQVVQEEIDRVVVKLQLVPRSAPMGEVIERVTRGIAGDLGDAIRLRVELVDDIPSEPNGKFRTFRCLVPRVDAG